MKDPQLKKQKPILPQEKQQPFPKNLSTRKMSIQEEKKKIKRQKLQQMTSKIDGSLKAKDKKSLTYNYYIQHEQELILADD